jgi:hypothetical protein
MPLHVADAPRAWLPEGLAVDRAGSLYVADAGAHAIERITPDGRLRTIARLKVTGDTPEPALLSSDAAGALYTVVEGTAVKIAPNGTVNIYAQSGLLSMTAIAGTSGSPDGSIYAAENDMPQPLFVARGDGIFTSVGGTGAPAMHCDLPSSAGDPAPRALPTVTRISSVAHAAPSH